MLQQQLNVNIENYAEVLEQLDSGCLVVGQAMGVGFTTNTTLFYLDKCFWNESYNVLFATSNTKTKEQIKQIITNTLSENYLYNCVFDGDTVKIYNNIISIFDFSTSDNITIKDVPEDFVFDVVVIDKDDGLNDKLEVFLKNLIPCKSLLISTYDFEGSLYFTRDAEFKKIILYGNNIVANNFNDIEDLILKRIVEGKFYDI